MNTSDLFTWSIQFLIVGILLFICYQLYHYYAQYNAYVQTTEPTYKGRGYCNIDAEYIKPILYSDFITPVENRYIIDTATPLFAESQLVSGTMKNVRKSQTAWLHRDDPVVSKIIGRVCDLVKISPKNAEKMQVVKYDQNGYYNLHYDASCDDRPECVEFEKNGGQRVITMLIYLNNEYDGGETDFPKLGSKYKPPKNSGLLFYSLEKNGNKCHPLSIHAGTPVKSGNKYIANIWLRETEYTIPQN
jgi:prolyl 4-hydroxylase